VLVVWEPILATDWSSPLGNTLARIPDHRARQFWDARHLVTQEVSRIAKKKPQPAPDCCVNKGNHWDEAILYASRSKWSNGPTPAFWNGPVVKVIPKLESVLREQP
jgi:hypothetical protein